MADKTYNLTFETSDGTKQTVRFTVPQGDKGDPGKNPVKGEDYFTPEDVQKIAEQAARMVGSSNQGALRVAEITLLATSWKGSGNLYSQIIAIDGITEYSQIDLTPSVEQLVIFHEKDLTFVTENEDGVVTVYAIGQKPTNDYTIQVTIKEVSA